MFLTGEGNRLVDDVIAEDVDNEAEELSALESMLVCTDLALVVCGRTVLVGTTGEIIGRGGTC